MGGLAGGLALGGLVGGALGGGGKNKNAYQTQQVGTLTPGQNYLLNTLAWRVGEQVNQPGAAYPGQMVARASPLQQQAFGDAPQAYGQGMAGLDTARTYLNRGVTPWNPYETEQMFQPIKDMALNTFNRDIAPGILNRYGAIDSARSSGAQRELAGAGADLLANLAAQLSPMQFQAWQANLNRNVAGSQQAAQLAGMPQQLGSQLYNMGVGQRGITGEMLQEPYSKWQMAQPWSNPALNYAGQALGTQAFNNIAYPKPPSTGQQLLGLAGNIGGGLMNMSAQNYFSQPGATMGGYFGK